MQRTRVAVIIGAGPAGLTAAYELLERTDIKPIVIESDPAYVGGISRTVCFKGNRIDIGGHRFFSKSERVMRWWSRFLPVRAPEGTPVTYRRTTRALVAGMQTASVQDGDDVLLVRPRKTHILYRGAFFDYPVSLSLATLRQFGIYKVVRIALTYVQARIFPVTPETTLEDFLRNRFGDELYRTFFKTYTEKVWGVPCVQLSAEWGAQRIKGLSITAAVMHALRKTFRIGALSGKGTETSLIEQFLYPPRGPGQMWEKVAEAVRGRGGEIRMGTEAIGLARADGCAIRSVLVRDVLGTEQAIPCDFVFSTADIQQLLRMMPAVPQDVATVAASLRYRDFITVGLLTDKKPIGRDGMLIADTWLYIHEESVQVGRIQLFHNWSPALVAHAEQGWIGMEYFCDEGDALWGASDASLIEQASRELAHIGLATGLTVLDGTVIRQRKAYPAYHGSYDNFDKVRAYLDTIPNLFPIGRNGMHRYNNQDHSMLAAMEAVDLICRGETYKSSLWRINAEQEYHEVKSDIAYRR